MAALFLDIDINGVSADSLYYGVDFNLKISLKALPVKNIQHFKIVELWCALMQQQVAAKTCRDHL